MKRYNIHLDPEWMKALDKIRQAVMKDGGNGYWWSGLSRSDLLRVAIGRYFELGKGYQHIYGDRLEKVIKKVLKKRRLGKSV